MKPKPKAVNKKDKEEERAAKQYLQQEAERAAKQYELAQRYKKWGPKK